MTAFANFATATLHFSVPTGSITAPLGNPATATTPLIVVAYLKADRSYRASQRPDGQISGQAMVGRAIAPAAIPATVQDGQAAEAILWRAGLGQLELPPAGFANLSAYQAFQAANAAAIALTGTFYIEVSPPGGFGVEAVLGDRIRGQFVARSSWADSL